MDRLGLQTKRVKKKRARERELHSHCENNIICLYWLLRYTENHTEMICSVSMCITFNIVIIIHLYFHPFFLAPLPYRTFASFACSQINKVQSYFMRHALTTGLMISLVFMEWMWGRVGLLCILCPVEWEITDRNCSMRSLIYISRTHSLPLALHRHLSSP